MALLLTFISGLFFLFGIIVQHNVKHKREFTYFSISCAAVVIVGLIATDLVPELLEISNWWIFLFIFVGLILLIIIDKFIPHHHHDHHENDDEGKDHQNHLEHIGVITIIALLLHNLTEGMALYSVTSNDLKSGILMLLGVGLHNLPFGFQIANYNYDKKNRWLVILLVLSGAIGGLVFSVFGSLNEIAEGIVIAITIGMLLHILLFELLKEVTRNIKKKESIYGIIIGIILLIIINLI